MHRLWLPTLIFQVERVLDSSDRQELLDNNERQNYQIWFSLCQVKLEPNDGRGSTGRNVLIDNQRQVDWWRINIRASCNFPHFTAGSQHLTLITSVSSQDFLKVPQSLVSVQDNPFHCGYLSLFFETVMTIWVSTVGPSSFLYSDNCCKQAHLLLGFPLDTISLDLWIERVRLKLQMQKQETTNFMLQVCLWKELLG